MMYGQSISHYKLVSQLGEGGGGTILTALTEQLGLRAESRQGPAPVLVVEKIEKPEAS